MKPIPSALLLLVVLALPLCSWISTIDPTETSRGNSSLACDHFRNIAGDLSQGVMTLSELRSKLKQVDDNASIGTPQVQAAARSMLRASTQDDGPAFLEAFRAMKTACAVSGN